MNEMEWMDLHLRCLYQHDAKDRILRKRDSRGLFCPLFHLGRTLLGNQWRFRDDLEPHAIRELSRLCGKEPPLAPDHSPPQRLEAIRSVLGSVADIVLEWRGPAFRFPDELPPQQDGTAGVEIVAVLPGMTSLLEASFSEWIPDVATGQPMWAAVEAGQVVSLCYAARARNVAGAGSSVATEVGVETAASHRGRGLAPRVVAAWGNAVRAGGGEPMYSTSWDNRASRAVARKLGLVLYGEDLHFA